MTPEAWQRVKAIFDAARELAPAERAALLDSSCGGDADGARDFAGDRQA